MTLYAFSLRVAGLAAVGLATLLAPPASAELSLTNSPDAANFILFSGKSAAPIFVETNDERAVIRAAGDLVEDVQRVTGTQTNSW